MGRGHAMDVSHAVHELEVEFQEQVEDGREVIM